MDVVVVVDVVVVAVVVVVVVVVVADVVVDVDDVVVNGFLMDGSQSESTIIKMRLPISIPRRKPLRIGDIDDQH